MPLDSRLWGKARKLGKNARLAENTHPVICHLLDTAAVAEVIWDELLTAHQRSMVAEALQVPEAEARALAAFWAGLHDIGKISVPFQLHRHGPKNADGTLLAAELGDQAAYAFDTRATEDRQSHEAAAHWWLVGLFQEIGYPSSKRRPQTRLSHAVSQLLGGHGGRYHPVLHDKDSRCPAARHPGLGVGGWEEQRRIHFAEVRRVVGAQVVPQGRMTPGAAVVLTGLVMLSDWLASIEDEIQTRLREVGWAGTPEDLDSYWQVARDAAPRLVRQTELLGTGFARPPGPSRYEDEAELHGSLARQLPGLVAAHGPGMAVVSSPPGEDRTRTALHAAAVLGHAVGARGLFYALPTGSAADSHMGQVHAFAEQALTGPWQSLLLHSSSRLNPAEAAGAWARASATGGIGGEPGEGWAPTANSWLNYRHRALLAPLGTGTVDELLQSMLPLAFNVMRLFAFSGKVVVVDEAHARGAWGQKLMLRFLEWAAALRIPVVLATATADKSVDAMLAAYRRGAGESKEPVKQPRRLPGWSFVDARSGAEHACEQPAAPDRAVTLSIEVVDGTPYDEVRAALARMAATGKRAAVVYQSSPEEAIRMFRQLEEDLPGFDVRLVHEQMCNKDRWQRLAACRSVFARTSGAPGPSVLVTTPMLQHVQGLHFDLVVSGPAPLADLLIRAEQRAGDAPRLLVLGAGAASALDDAGLVRRTAELLGAGRTVSLPDEGPLLLDEVYADELVDGLEDAVARELRQLDNRRTVRERAGSGTAGWAAVPGPRELEGDLGQLSRYHPGMGPELLTRVLGGEMVQVVCLYSGYNKQGQDVYFLEDGVLEEKTGPPGKKKPNPAQFVPYLVPVPKRLLQGVEGDANRTWHDMAALKAVLRLHLDPVDDRWEHTTPTHHFRMSHLGLEIEHLP
ncbi:CRISPR-associated endonuclease Cas3'' [Streptomyces iconiensis]|uniref:CRISPR-associated endonuclease Cas3 n=1 Tax=Streptomyces iconiensis TaxID=1384038 RepID=A0ABT6ZNE1_9ACTN|nr:CRISPR-associated endonuclease Cas3'' [Streptomyces iconiensis]MDJ1130576.1 CRISPR-associated endonuclease Cas3'' [Streptomyces iconiensis]